VRKLKSVVSIQTLMRVCDNASWSLKKPIAGTCVDHVFSFDKLAGCENFAT
jgi:hypothetical protein